MARTIQVTNAVSNKTTYDLRVKSDHLNNGEWTVKPKALPARSDTHDAFQAEGDRGTGSGIEGNVIYNVHRGDNVLGTCSFTFNDPFTGPNDARFATTVKDLNGVPEFPKDGRTITIQWTLTSAI